MSAGICSAWCQTASLHEVSSGFKTDGKAWKLCFQRDTKRQQRNAKNNYIDTQKDPGFSTKVKHNDDKDPKLPQKDTNWPKRRHKMATKRLKMILRIQKKYTDWLQWYKLATKTHKMTTKNHKMTRMRQKTTTNCLQEIQNDHKGHKMATETQYDDKEK